MSNISVLTRLGRVRGSLCPEWGWRGSRWGNGCVAPSRRLRHALYGIHSCALVVKFIYTRAQRSFERSSTRG